MCSCVEVPGSRALSAATGKLVIPADLHSTKMLEDVHLQYTAPGIGRVVLDSQWQVLWLPRS